MRLVGLALLTVSTAFSQSRAEEWNRPFEPFRIIGNVYYVGPAGLSSYLITTPKGHVLIDSGYENSVPLIRASVKKLGFRFEDIKVLLNSHAHGDHAAGHALVKEFSGAQIAISEPDVPVIRSGNSGRWKPAKVDRTLKDGDQVTLGGVTLTAHLTPGHTKGCTTWTMTVTEGGRKYEVLFLGGFSVNPGTKLVHNEEYPGIADDYQRTFRVLKTLKADVFLAQHGEIFDLAGKAARHRAGAKPTPFLDADGYRRAVDEAEISFHAELKTQVERLSHWPQFRGPKGHGIAASSAPAEFGPKKNVVWKTAIPTGHSSPVIVGDRIFLTGEEGGKRSDAGRDKVNSDGVLQTFALDRKDGRILWRKEVPRPRQERYQPTNSAASGSAASDGNNIYVFFGDFGLISYRFDGEERWRLPLGPFNNVNGHGASPILHGTKLYMICDQDSDSYLLALDKDTGKVAWKVERPEVTRAYSTPAIYQPKGGPAELIVPGSFLLTSYNAETGEKLWWVRGQSWQPKSLPIVDGDVIYAHSWEGGGEAEQPTETPTFPEILSQWDDNKDGSLAEAEIRDARWKRGYYTMDLNGDGKMTSGEWDFFRARRSARNQLVAVRGGGRGDITTSHVIWNMQKFLPNVPSPLLYRNVMYLVKDGGVLTAVDPANGKILKQGRLPGALDTYYASPIAAGDMVYFLSQNGKATVAKAGAEWEVVASNDMEEECFATPVALDGRLYLRTKSALYSFGQ